MPLSTAERLKRWKRFIRAIRQGRSLKAACLYAPCNSESIYRWMRLWPVWEKEYRQAIKESSHQWADKAVVEAFQATDKHNANAARVRSSICQWRAGAADRAQWSERQPPSITVTQSNQQSAVAVSNITFRSLHISALRQRSALPRHRPDAIQAIEASPSSPSLPTPSIDTQNGGTSGEAAHTPNATSQTSTTAHHEPISHAQT